jgi:5'-nucleotidase/UDP-sugar diphosphatase
MQHKVCRAALILAAWVVAGCTSDSSGPGVALEAGPPVPDRGPDDRGNVPVPDGGAADTMPHKPTLLVLHTNDMHDHLMGWSPNADYTPGVTGDDNTVGGFARLAATIEAQRAAAGKATEVLLLDGGDFSMGTLFTWLGANHAPALTLMDQLGYDATVLGNHEFEWGPQVLAQRIQAARNAGVKVEILSSNITFSAGDSGDDALEALMASGAIKRKLVKTLGSGLKVGLFGLMGEAAADVALDKDPVTFADPVATAKQLVTELRNVDKVDMVICLSHSGIDPAGDGEDADLAAAVPGIDVIISGHTHDTLPQPAVVGPSGTRIVQTGKFGANLGRLEFVYDRAMTLGMVTYELLPLDDSSKGSPSVQQAIDGHITKIDKMLMPDLAYRMVVGETAFDLTKPPFQETLLGNLVSDAYRMTVNKLQPAAPADVAIASAGHIRDELIRGKTGQIWFADLYRVLPLGFGPDGKAGYPLVSYYLKGKEIKTWMEILYLAEHVMDSKSMYFQVSGIDVVYDTSWVIPLFSVESVVLTSSPGAPEIKDSNSCFKVVSSLAIAEELSRAKSYSFGIMKIEPKLKDCSTKITDLKQQIVDAAPGQPGVQELKCWRALTDYVSSFPDTDADAIPNIPSSYGTLQGRIVAK